MLILSSLKKAKTVFLNICLDPPPHSKTHRYPPYNLEEAYNLSTHKKPIIIILSPGANPMEDLRALAVKRNMHHGLVPISLGKGQGKAAKIAIDQALKGIERQRRKLGHNAELPSGRQLSSYNRKDDPRDS